MKDELIENLLRMRDGKESYRYDIEEISFENLKAEITVDALENLFGITISEGMNRKGIDDIVVPSVYL